MAEDEKAVKLPSKAILQRLHKQAIETKKETQAASGEFGNAVAQASEKHSLHAKAFKTVSSWLRMPPTKLFELLTHIDDYREKLEIDKAAGVDIFAGETGKSKAKKAKADEGEDEIEDKRANVAQFPGSAQASA